MRLVVQVPILVIPPPNTLVWIVSLANIKKNLVEPLVRIVERALSKNILAVSIVASVPMEPIMVNTHHNRTLFFFKHVLFIHLL